MHEGGHISKEFSKLFLYSIANLSLLKPLLLKVGLSAIDLFLLTCNCFYLNWLILFSSRYLQTNRTVNCQIVVIHGVGQYSYLI